jgi:hypothetical protein
VSREPQEPRNPRMAWIRSRLGIKPGRPAAVGTFDARAQGALESREMRTRPVTIQQNRFGLKRALRHLLYDIAVGLVWALLLAAAIIFMSGVSQFIYVDF